jgi:hypothetical protein
VELGRLHHQARASTRGGEEVRRDKEKQLSPSSINLN